MSTKYTEEQVWIRPEGEFATIGITPHAQDALGDIVVYMPASGVVTEVNEALRADPSLANTAPLEAGWFFKVKLTDAAQLAGLMDEAAYAKFEG
jgi:glycine cleavage system H protein